MSFAVPRAVSSSAAALLALVVLLLAGAVALGSTGSAPELFNVETSGVFATRASFGGEVRSNGSDASWSVEYTTNESAGPWTLVQSGTCANGQVCGTGVEVHHLTPQTTYYFRVSAENVSGRSVKTGSFTTLASARPELDELGGVGGSTISSITVADEIQTNDLETTYGIEYSATKGGPWTPAPGCSGAITVAEDFARHECRIAGLAPETTYYVLYKASNIDGEAKILSGEPQEHAVRTASAKPEAYTPEITNVTGVSAHLRGGVNPHTYETQWRYEYATSEAGPWTPAAGGTIPSSDAGETSIRVGGEIDGLSPSTTYYVRVFAKNAYGESYSDTKNFAHFQTTGPPVVETFAVHAIDGEAIRLLGSVNPESTGIGSEQSVTIGGAPTGGSFTLTFKGQTTVPIPFDASAGFVQQELGGLSTIGADNLAVTGLPGGPYTVEFEKAAAGVSQPLLVANASDLTPSGTVTVATVTEGGAGYDTHYHFQYITQEQFETGGAEPFAGAASTPEVNLGSGTSPAVVSADLPELSPATPYRFRLVATSTFPGNPVVDGAEQVFTAPSQSAGSEQSCPNESLRSGPSVGLPDCRAYEQVTPADKEGAEDIFSFAALETEAQVGEDGEHVMVSQTGLQWGSSPDPTQGNYVLSRTPNGWETTSLRPSGETSASGYQPQLLGADLTEFALEVGWSIGNGHTQSPEIGFMAGPTGGPYTTVASVPRDEVIPDDGDGWVAASKDFSKLVLQVHDHELVSGQPTGTISGADLYEWSESSLRQVNAGIGTCGAVIVHGREGYGHSGLEGGHAVSANGSRVFFEATPGSDCAEPKHLYMRVGEAAPTDIGAYRFMAANADGTTLLLERDSAGVIEVLLYQTETAEATLLFSTKQLGQVVVSEDLAALYFYSVESLTPEAPPVSDDYEDAIDTSPSNLYRYDITQKALRFVAQAGAEGELGGGVSVSPDGRYFYFASRGVAGVAPAATAENEAPSKFDYSRVYRYDSVENVVQCMECASSFDPEPVGTATFLPEGIGQEYKGVSINDVPMPRVASDNGDYVFFDTTAALVPTDIDGEARSGGIEKGEDFYFSNSSDVYEWRKNGIDGCAQVQGCLSLISSGAGGEKNMLLGTTASGNDVFFATHAQLVGQDQDTAGDVYDARVDGGFAEPTRAVECEGSGCDIPLPAPTDTTPASLTFSGPANLQPAPVKAPKPKAKPKAKAKTGCKAKVKRKCRPRPEKARSRRKAKKSNKRSK